MKYKSFIILFVFIILSNCGVYFKYVKTKEVGDVNLYNKNVGIINIDIPVYLVEKSMTLKENLYNDLSVILKKNKVNIKSIRTLKDESSYKKIYKNDLYNWFFRSDSFKSDNINVLFDLANVDFLLNIKILKFEEGTTLNNSWIKMAINIYDAKTRDLKDIITYEGFYKYIKSEMYKTLK